MVIAFILLGIVVVVGLVLDGLSKRGKISETSGEIVPENAARYQLRTDFLSAAEVSFYKVLLLATGDKLTVFAKVRLADIITPAVQDNRSAWQKLFNRISAKHVDFLICDSTTLKPMIVVELDDKSHSKPDVASRDNEVNAALKSAGIAIVRVVCRKSYQIDEVRDAFVGTPVEALLGVSADAKYMPKSGK